LRFSPTANSQHSSNASPQISIAPAISQRIERRVAKNHAVSDWEYIIMKQFVVEEFHYHERY